MSARLTVLLCLLAVFALAPKAMAEDAGGDPKDVLGAWTFQTKPYRNGTCGMTGMMRLSPHEEEGVYACELTAVEVCSLWGRSVVVQSCEARRFGNQVSVRSKIEQMLERKFDTDDEAFSYVPDNFALTIQSAQRMYGALVSAVSAPVEFRRMPEGVS